MPDRFFLPRLSAQVLVPPKRRLIRGLGPAVICPRAHSAIHAPHTCLKVRQLASSARDAQRRRDRPAAPISIWDQRLSVPIARHSRESACEEIFASSSRRRPGPIAPPLRRSQSRGNTLPVWESPYQGAIGPGLRRGDEGTGDRRISSQARKRESKSCRRLRGNPRFRGGDDNPLTERAPRRRAHLCLLRLTFAFSVNSVVEA